MQRLPHLVMFGVLGLCLDTLAFTPEASACGSIFGGPHCRDQTQVCQQGCPLLSCDQLVANFDNPPNSFSSSFFAGGIGHCARLGARQAILDCAWQELIRTFPEIQSVPATASCLQSRLFTSTRTQQLLDRTAAPDPNSIAKHTRFAGFPAPEPCDHPDGGGHTAVLPTEQGIPLYFEPSILRVLLDSPPNGAFNVPAAHHIGSNEGRLRPDLRQAARVAQPLSCSLPLASIHYARATTPDDRALAQAYADLSVTGRKAFAAFQSAAPQDSFCESLDTRHLAAGCPVASGAMPPRDRLVAGCLQALDRAYRVASFVRAGETLRTGAGLYGPDGRYTPAAAAERTRKLTERQALGYIAVSGEDDQPHRPVNVPSSDYPQYDLDVDVPAPFAPRPSRGGSAGAGPSVGTPNPQLPTVHTRYTIAQSRSGVAVEPSAPSGNHSLRRIAASPALAIGPDAEILLFIPGMGSRAEEAGDLTRALFKAVAGKPRNLVVISVDLPTSGYADNLDYTVVSDLNKIGIPENKPFPDFTATGQVPVLDFLEDFIVAFVDKLDTTLHIKPHIKGVMGGSLGGNLAFRLGRRPNVPWLRRVISWSPASIWNSLGEGADVAKHQGPRTAYERANNRDPNDPFDLGPSRIGLRRAFFEDWDKPILPVIIPMAQSDAWTSNDYQCHSSSIAAARLDRHETYNAQVQTWHWRLGGEQLLYSHQTIDPATRRQRFMLNTKPMLLACGTEDHVPFNDICPATQATAARMTMTPGEAIILQQTGHSLDNERPTFWAAEVLKFLEQWP